MLFMYLYCTHPPICKKEILLKLLTAKWLSPENCILSINVKPNTGKYSGQTLQAGWCPPWCRRLDIPMQIPVSPGGSSSLPTDPPECTMVCRDHVRLNTFPLESVSQVSCAASQSSMPATQWGQFRTASVVIPAVI